MRRAQSHSWFRTHWDTTENSAIGGTLNLCDLRVANVSITAALPLARETQAINKV
jgi:hypothetical protein